MSSDPMKRYDAFLSHNSNDKPVVEEIARRLQAAGIEPFLDQWHLVPGEPWQEALEDALTESSTCAVFLGPEGIGPWENEEMRVALDERARKRMSRVIPVLLPGATMPEPPKLPRFLSRLTWVDFRDGLDDENAFHRFVAGIRGLPPGPPPATSETTSCRYWNVPHRRNPFFTGRGEILEALHRALHQEDSAALGQTQAISGLGGIGKTQTAVEYAYRYRDNYQAVLWTRAETEAELAGGFSDLAAVLDLPERDTKDQEQAVQAVKRWLEATPSWLLVLDNADDPALVEPYVPTDPRGHILLTSRARLFDNLGIRKPVRVATWPREESLAFLLERTGCVDAGDEEREAASNLAEEVGDLPLALEQAGAFMAERQTRFEDYLRSFEKRHLRLLEKAQPRAAAYRGSVATTWAINFDEVGKGSAEILRLCAFLAPDRIPVEILTLGASELGPTLSAALKNADDDPMVLDELLEPLSRYSLIERDPEARRFTVHRMVQQVVRAAVGESVRPRLAERAVRALSRAFPSEELSTWPLCERLVVQATAALELVNRYELELGPAATMLNEAGIYSIRRGRYRQATPLLKRSLAIRENVLGAEHLDVAASLNNLANLHRILGDYSSAESLHSRSLAIRERVLGAEHRDVAESLNNLGSLRWAQRDYASAAPLYQRSRAILEALLGPEHPDIAPSLNNLALLHHDQGEYASAARLYQRSLTIREKALGAEHPDVAASLNNLALLYSNQGDHASAAPLYERSLAIRENVLGAEHRDVAQSLYNLALLYSEQRSYAKSAPLYERALAILERTLGTEHPRMVMVLENYAELLEQTDRAEEAANLKARADAIRAKRVTDDPD